jgi:WD40 repeat protein
MKRLILTALAAAALLGLAVSVSLAYTGTGTSFPLIVVDNGGGDQSDPHVSGRYATYTAEQSTGSVAVKYFDFATQTTGTVPSVAGSLDSLSDISGGTIVFTRVDLITGASAVYSYPIGGTPAEVAPVAPALPLRRNPAIGGSTVAWEDSAVSADANPELVVDSAGTVTQLTNDPPADQNPSVSPDGSTVVWEKCAASCDVYAAVKAGSSWNLAQVTATAVNETSPDTNGSIVAYASDANGPSHVHFRPLSGGADQTIPMPPGWVSENHPAIAGDFLAFESSDGVQTDVWVYDIADNSLRQITNTTGNEMLADLTVSARERTPSPSSGR